MKPIFVYGTLRPGQHNYHFVQAHVQYAIPAEAPNLQLYDLGHFPMAFMQAGTVYGHVLWLAPVAYKSVLNQLDKLEGHPFFYERVVWQVLQKAPGQEPMWVSVWVYVGTQPERYTTYPHIIGGDWVKYLHQRSS